MHVAVIFLTGFLKKTTMSSAIPVTPSHPSYVWSIFVSKVSCDIFKPKGQAVESVSTERGVECGAVT